MDFSKPALKERAFFMEKAYYTYPKVLNWFVVTALVGKPTKAVTTNLMWTYGKLYYSSEGMIRTCPTSI